VLINTAYNVCLEDGHVVNFELLKLLILPHRFYGSGFQGSSTWWSDTGCWKKSSCPVLRYLSDLSCRTHDNVTEFRGILYPSHSSKTLLLTSSCLTAYHLWSISFTGKNSPGQKVLLEIKKSFSANTDVMRVLCVLGVLVVSHQNAGHFIGPASILSQHVI